MVDGAELVAKMREGIARLLRESEERTSTTLDALHARALRGEAGLDAPHSDPKWRFRSRKVFERARDLKMVWSMPWHHQETWLWAASTGAGVDWIESEVRYWERKVESHARWMAKRAKEQRELPRLEYVYQEGDELLFVEDDENLKERVDALRLSG